MEDSSLPSKPNVDEEWINEIENKINNAFSCSPFWPTQIHDKIDTKICKFMLGEEISRPRLVKVEEFSQPSVVNIGPFHRQERTSIFDDKKWVIVCLMNLLYNLDLKSCLIKMKNQVANARKRYSDIHISQSSDFKDDNWFAEMLLQDSYFILFLLTITICKRPSGYTLTSMKPNSEPLSLFRDEAFKFLDIMFHKDKVAPDLLILDNQIPFFVIEELFEMLQLEKPLYKCALEFFETIHPRSIEGGRKGKINSVPEFLHLLDLFHWSRVTENEHIKLGPSSRQLDSSGWARYTPTAMELGESAIMIKKKKHGSSLDITFRRCRLILLMRVLSIPELHIRGYSSFVFHNLIAFEIQSSSRGHGTIAFSTFMRNLLQSEGDVRLLRRRGVLASSIMTDGEVVYFFDCLSKLTESYQMQSDLCDVWHHVRSHHGGQMNRFCGYVILQYFPNPLVTLSVIAAIMLFVLTLLQTIYSMLGYYPR